MEYEFTKDTLKYMYRYLLKYVGTYRVKSEFDLITEDFPRDDNGQIDPSFEDLYIPCKLGVIKHTYMGNDILVCCFYNKIKTGIRTYERLHKKYPTMNLDVEESSPDYFIYFNAKDLKNIATIVKPSTTGKGIDPYSKKNLPKIEYEIPSKDLNQIYRVTKDLDRIQTLHFFKKINSEFLDSMSNDKTNYTVQAKKSRLNTREFIHFSGLWPEYIKFIKQHI